MRANGDINKPIWLTEFRLATRNRTRRRHGRGVARRRDTQPRLIHDVYAGLKVDAIFFYQAAPTPPSSARAGQSSTCTGDWLSRDFTHQNPASRVQGRPKPGCAKD